MEERPTIAFRVDDSQKERWKTYAEDNPEYDSLSHLLRVAVAHEMSDQYGRGGSGGIDSGGQIGELVTAVNKIDSRLEEVEENVENATDAMYSGGTSVSEDVTSAVYEALPTSPEQARSTHWIAEETERDKTTVRVALEQLDKTTGVVNKVEMKDIVTDENGRIVAGEEHEDPQWYKRE
ncbi:hypothetical protein [Halorubrum halophilum]|uniref:hypothetical protein n=1 Tax=Halorubrum halophilum TaxID=413816 RepID=UPI00186B3A5F|nr:hypothetical protein [Halorubrum halophilum]